MTDLKRLLGAEDIQLETRFATPATLDALIAQGFAVHSVRQGGSGWEQYLMYRATDKEGNIVTDIDVTWAPKTEGDVTQFTDELAQVYEQIFDELSKMNDVKGALYQDAAGVDSCLKRGFGGVFQNIARKFDRLQAVAERHGVTATTNAAVEAEAAQDKGDPETLYVTMKDMAVYCIHAMRFLKGMQERD